MAVNKRSAPPARPLALLIGAALVLGLLGGCETMPTKVSELPLLGQRAPALPSPTAELAPPLARTWPDPQQDVLNHRARDYGLVNAPEMQRYLNTLYARIKVRAGVPAWPGTVQILATEALSAYATAAGNLYVSLPWLTSVESEDELVALLSHEFGHVYLHYHQLEGAVEDANTAVGWVGAGFAIVKKTGQATGWNKLDSLTSAYILGRSLATTVYGRLQESAADNFGLNLSLKLGYSYEHGMKAFLERQATWEERNALLQKRREEQILALVRQQSMDAAVKTQAAQPKTQIGDALAKVNGELSGSINAAAQQAAFGLGKLFNDLTSKHPETTQRIDVLALMVEPHPAILDGKEPLVSPLKAALLEKRTAAIVKNYALAFGVINAPQQAEAAKLARVAVSAPTAGHAVPLLALYTVLSAQPQAAGKKYVDPGSVFEANFNSEPDRAWRIYKERGVSLKNKQQAAAAKKVIDLGLAYFRNAEEAWPDAIQFYGETQGWDEAKRMAASCGKNFRRVSARCTQAAATPAEIAEAERRNQVKTDQMSEKMFKKQ